MSFRVDNIPFYLKPFFYLYGYGFFLFNFGLSWIFHHICKIEFKNKEIEENLKNYILVYWHTDLIPYFIVFTKHKRQHIWMNHPHWTMKPVHLWLKKIGIKKIALGSSGSEGKEAVNKVIKYLKEGWCTSINPDGPAGPIYIAKKGCFYMSQQSGVPLLPIKIHTNDLLTLPSWDNKRIPMPFSKIVVEYMQPIQPDQNIESMQQELLDKLNAH